ncbi:methyltransferase, FxLD system [Amycolatopsis sp. H20-H5]|uniref:methyltransferase, FxLD system n=1 Tax=Amycolatopsis sp. H20-H5 TaxID=3046309 RepID=UPI002DBEC6E8|nr:methyltransferase, FxLD system [Amycolatopsis sp. H20-H5]MEC3974281.1 methyltransferase, FxLD system [Amycolatopsis sp. H20-H5]
MNTLRDDDTVTDRAAVLRAAMVEQLRTHDELCSDALIRAFATVPREAFAPGAPLEQVYNRDDVVITQRDENGLATSSVSAPRIQAMMLEQADIRPGMRVLEIGSGGYNAALIAELVGPNGHVTTVDIDSFVTDRAAEFLADTGYSRVRVVRADAEGGVPGHAPFDRIVVTAGAWDIPPAWTEQLAEGGVLVVPLRMRGLTRSVALVREQGRLVSRGYVLCGFVPILGVGANAERLVLLRGEDVALRVDADQAVDADALREALSVPRVVRESGVEVGGFESFDELDLFLATALDDFGLLVAKSEMIEAGVVERSARMGAKTALAGSSFAYRASQATSEDRTSFEFVVYGHGRDGESIAEKYVALIREWDRVHRHGPGARIEVFPAGTPDAEIGEGRLMEKKHTRVLVSWPSSS